MNLFGNLGEIFQSPAIAPGGLFAPGLPQPPSKELISPDANARRAAFQRKPEAKDTPGSDAASHHLELPDGAGNGMHSHNPIKERLNSSEWGDDGPGDDGPGDDDVPPTQPDGEPNDRDIVSPSPPQNPAPMARTAGINRDGKFVDENGKSMYENGLYWKTLGLHDFSCIVSLRVWEVIELNLVGPPAPRMKRYFAPKLGAAASKEALAMFQDKEKRTIVA